MSGKSEGISRRAFTKVSVFGAALLAFGKLTRGASGNMNNSSLRLGGPVFEKYDSPDAWVKALKALGYSAAYCPVGAKESDDVVRAYAKAAKEANIVIAEVGARTKRCVRRPLRNAAHNWIWRIESEQTAA